MTRDLKEELPVQKQFIAVQQAIFFGYRYWKEDSLSILHCGFRYLLPQGDKVGTNALFWQIAASCASHNGNYLFCIS